MDIGTRFQSRMRPDALLDHNHHLDHNAHALPDDSGTESESLTRRKFQRTTADADSNNPHDSFRRPTVPASASRPQMDRKPSLTHRRRSTLRETMRVPSGPRDYPGGAGKRNVSGSTSSITHSRAPSVGDSAGTTRSFLPQSTSDTFFSKHPADAPRSALSRQPTLKTADRFDFIPTVNFDDLQTSIANYDGNTPLLSDFPAAGHGRTLSRKESSSSLSKNSTMSRVDTSSPMVPTFSTQHTEPREEPETSRRKSLRNRLSAVGSSRQTTSHNLDKDSSFPSVQQSRLSLRSRRQSTVHAPQQSGAPPPPTAAESRPARKSLGPGMISSMMEGRKASQQLPTSLPDTGLKNVPPRTISLSKAARRTTLHSPGTGGAELPRAITTTTQSRANKVKSLQPPPREYAEQDPNTPPVRPASKGNPSRAHTPSSSGKRQSTISGRASGLGARTISPTDARRLKRMSMMQAPPLPSHPQKELPPPPPVDEPYTSKTELPRLTQPSPSLIPRRTNVATPPSARASPEGRFAQGGGVSLSTRSSYASLNNSSGSASRLPTPKPRPVHSSGAQYTEDEDIVPPVPAIPRAYGSPKETDQQFFSTTPVTSSRSEHFSSGELASATSDGSISGPKVAPEPSTDARGKQSGERIRTHHRKPTIDEIERTVNAATTGKSSRPQQEYSGRKPERKPGNLQPLRLPPLNLMPIGAPSSRRSGDRPRPSADAPPPDDFSFIQTPEPKRQPKTPTTPMTASKATFWRRHEDDGSKPKIARSSTSHFALRDLMRLDHDSTRYFDDNDAGVAIPAAKRSAITPFSSGSLPKVSGEFARSQRAGQKNEYNEEHSLGKFQNHQIQNSPLPQKPHGPRPSRSGTAASYKTAETPSSIESATLDSSSVETKKEKENTTSGLRRKLSLGWRRSSSKVNIDVKTLPQDGSASEKEKPTRLQKRPTEMPPPKLPASATWSGDVPAMPTASTSFNLDSMRRKSGALQSSHTTASSNDTEKSTPVKTKSALHNDQPQPVASTQRATSFGNFMSHARTASKATPVTHQPRKPAASTVINVNVKDKDDAAADDEMRRLSQKRRDVDTAARESEELRKRAIPHSPMTPDRVLHDRDCSLNIFERGEILDYEKDGVYFTGTKNARKIVGSLTSSPPTGDKDSKSGNYGYDDERGDYNIVLGDHLAYRYEVVDVLGKGSFGQVVRCVDHKEGGVVAVKIIRNKKRFHQQALVEVGILGRLREWDPEGSYATLSITSSFYFRSHLCIVTPCLSINLYELIRAHNFVGFSLPLIRRFARQLLACLVLLQNKRIIHCDLKPENILLCEARKADVRVIDFGSSCKEEEKVYTYIQSRFYRSPEVILGSSYGLGIDMWSLGCILAELWTGYPLFPGENEQEQLACIMEIFGPPDRHLVDRCTRKKLFFDSVGKPRVTVSSKGRRRRPSSKTLAQALKTEDEAFLDFISRCLRWDPDRRLKPQDAMNHPFITNQPLNSRPGIPDEARRAARVRPTTAVPTTNGSLPSPVKRLHTVSGTHASSASTYASQQATPAKERNRPLPETPQTAVKNNASTTQMSPSKTSGIGVRKPSIVGIGSAANATVTGSKRTSNGVPIASANTTGVNTQQRITSGGSANSANLAQSAAREANSARWRA